jgi:hypothetical protein
MKDLLKGIGSTPEDVMLAFSSSRPHPPVNYSTELSHTHTHIYIYNNNTLSPCSWYMDGVVDTMIAQNHH